MRNLRQKICRFVFLFLLVILGLYHFATNYQKSTPRLLQFSIPGMEALIYYELGAYKRASQAWRVHYGCAYNMQLTEITKQNLIDRIEKGPPNLESYLWLADLYFFLEEYPNASLTYKKALQTNGNSHDAKVGLASSLLMEGKYRESHDLFDDLLNQGYQEKNITSFLNFLVALDKMGKAKIPGQRDSYIALLDAYRYLAALDPRKINKAISFCDTSIAAKKHLDLAFSSKGLIYTKQKEYAMALEQYSRAVGISPSNADAYERMACLYGEMGDLEKEVQYYKKAAEVGRTNPVYASHLGEILMKKYGDFKQANFYFWLAYRLDPENFRHASNYALALQILGRFREALEVYDHLISTNPEAPDGYVLKGHCLVKMKEYEKAIQSYSKAQAIRPLDFLAARNLTFACFKVKDFEKAVTYGEYALRIHPQDVDTLFLIQTVYQGQGRFPEARHAVTEILKIQPNHAGAQRVLPYLDSHKKARSSS
jgi:tetratricopeptide (TPR) repeat protein